MQILYLLSNTEDEYLFCLGVFPNMFHECMSVLHHDLANSNLKKPSRMIADTYIALVTCAREPHTSPPRSVTTSIPT